MNCFDCTHAHQPTSRRTLVSGRPAVSSLRWLLIQTDASGGAAGSDRGVNLRPAIRPLAIEGPLPQSPYACSDEDRGTQDDCRCEARLAAHNQEDRSYSDQQPSRDHRAVGSFRGPLFILFLSSATETAKRHIPACGDTANLRGSIIYRPRWDFTPRPSRDEPDPIVGPPTGPTGGPRGAGVVIHAKSLSASTNRLASRCRLQGSGALPNAGGIR
jgi:hypothetical protein